MQPCQRHTDDSSASRESSGRETEGVKSLGVRRRGERLERDLKTKRKEREGGREVWMCNHLFHCCTNTKQDSAYCESQSELARAHELYVCVNMWLFVGFGLKGAERVFYKFVCVLIGVCVCGGWGCCIGVFVTRGC